MTETSDNATPNDNPSPDSDVTETIGPVKPQPMAFKIAMVLMIGWLLFLAYIAYQVLF